MSYFYESNDFNLDTMFYDENKSTSQENFVTSGGFSPVNFVQNTPQAFLFENVDTPGRNGDDNYTPGNPDEVN
eukprot:CAMPEP_0114585842 /NCGR_PEP_ID=MMETSP0125-20121206/9261_1 /TAXON_ID=485358 ORGANISM="Aristerostoma sp., Strain ATCC 50986" /NCGR_SAMPLE_ID=MMETSP0125 /ASSEMBLY_ACC=CAM_ASM_000245 /LENGTH=72 /DNA_ID=CAMNT_0001781075 /DNA_START=154 /DNA_END=372 /DNA_ORIENTATION=-